MRALVSYGPQDGNVEIGDLPEPVLRAGTVRVRIVSVGVCGSDLHMGGAPRAGRSAYRSRSATKRRAWSSRWATGWMSGGWATG